MAKGVEDTAFYRYGRLLALNDVGGDPSRIRIELERFHAGSRERAERFPLGLLTTMTHDAKRSADVRARISALASAPSSWREQIRALVRRSLEPLRRDGAPDDVERYFIFQTLVGAWPISSERIEAYIEKALREAKRNTNGFRRTPNGSRPSSSSAAPCIRRANFSTSLSRSRHGLATIGDQVGTASVRAEAHGPRYSGHLPGRRAPVSGARRPRQPLAVDFRWREAMLRRLMGGSPPDDETRKMFLIMRLFGLGRETSRSVGGYEPLDAGADACAYLRGDDVLVVVAACGFGGSLRAKSSCRGGRWRDVLRGEQRSLGPVSHIERVLGEERAGRLRAIGSRHHIG